VKIRGTVSLRQRGRTAVGQTSIEFALIYGAVILPLTFMTIFVAEMLWVWHSVAEFTREGASYAATHCATDGSNVVAYMQSRVPPMIDRDRFQSGEVGIQVQYFSRNADGNVSPYDPAGCAGCVPDNVSVSITGYQFLRFAGFLGVAPATLPPFTTNVPMESAGYNDASGSCTP
jgi:hypothetical protein